MKDTFFALFISGFLFTCQSPETGRQEVATEMENHLRHEVLDRWYPQNFDTLYGGFLSSFTYDFKPTGDQKKMIVTQARHTWTNAKAALRYPDQPQFARGAKHGFAFLREVMWDPEFGGFFQLVEQSGKHIETDTIKTAYGNAFGIYALAAYYNFSHDTAGLNFARESFQWLEANSHDEVNKGFFQHLNRNGTPIKRNGSVPSSSDLGYKDQNSSIHLLEAFTELYQVWPDPLVRERLAEMLFLIRDRMVSPSGYLILFFQPDWTPVSFRDSTKSSIESHHYLDHVSFGHDVETAYLMLEASHVLGLENDSITLKVARKMIDHAIQNGWDNSVGGFYDEGYYFQDTPGITITHDTKNWWAQAEGLNSLLLFSDLFPDDRMQYHKKFEQLWRYCELYLIDHENGDWYAGGLDKQPELKTAQKGHIWKGIYHHYRSLANCVDRLQGRSH